MPDSWLRKFLEESVKWYKQKIAEAEKRKAQLKKLLKGAAGPAETKAIQDAINNADEMIKLYEKAIKQTKKSIEES